MSNDEFDIEFGPNYIDVTIDPYYVDTGGSVGPPGPQGPAGPVGPQGPPGTGTTLAFTSAKTTTTPYEVDLTTTNLLYCDCTANPIQVILPTSNSGNKDLGIIVKKLDGTSFSVSVQTTGGQLIDNLSSFTISGRSSYMFVSTGSGYTVN